MKFHKFSLVTAWILGTHLILEIDSREISRKVMKQTPAEDRIWMPPYFALPFQKYGSPFPCPFIFSQYTGMNGRSCQGPPPYLQKPPSTPPPPPTPEADPSPKPEAPELKGEDSENDGEDAEGDQEEYVVEYKPKKRRRQKCGCRKRHYY